MLNPHAFPTKQNSLMSVGSLMSVFEVPELIVEEELSP